MVAFDFSELKALSADLGEVAAKSGTPVRKAVEVSARKVKDAARKSVRGRKGLGHAANAIDYELKGFQGFGATVLDAEIGYDKDKKGGKLGNLIEYGAPDARKHMLIGKRNVPVPGDHRLPLAPSADLQNALHENEADFEAGIEKAVDDMLKASGL